MWTPFLDWKQRQVKTEFKESEHIFIPNYNEVIEHLKEIPYSDYLLTEHWVYFSKRVKKYYGNKCMMCNSKDNIIDVHHRTYENRGREMYDDVILLCRICHAKFHDKNK